MIPEIDHYLILGLPSGEEGSKLTKNEISKAYKLKALELHPDKRPNDPNANAEFQTLSSSYEFLTDEASRKGFDDLLRAEKIKKRNHDDEECRREYESRFQSVVRRGDRKRRRRNPDLRRRKSDNGEPGFVEPDFEEPDDKELKNMISDILLSMDASEEEGVDNMDKILKVRWAGNGKHYSSERLRELFGEFGHVEDVIVPLKKCGKKEKWCAFVVMESKDDAYVAMRCVYGDISNPLVVLPVYKKVSADSTTELFTAKKHKDPFAKNYKQKFGQTFSLFR